MEKREIKYKEDYDKVSYDSMITSHELREQKIIKILKIIFVVAIILIIRGIAGPLVINNPFGYPSSVNRFYEIKINNKVLASYSLYNIKFPIIPLFIYVKSSNDDMFDEDLDEEELFFGDSYYMDFNTYECYYQRRRVRCRSYKDKTKEMKYKLKYVTLEKIGDESKILYKGKMIHNITKYIDEPGTYWLMFEGSFGLTNFSVEAQFNIVKQMDMENDIWNL